MMLKTANGFLDFDGDVEMERQVKLFEDIKETWGDFSYTFELSLTQNNISLLGIPFPDNISKVVYNKVTADLLSDSGEVLYKGFLRVERVNEVIETSFFSGNNNWLGELTGNMTELRLDQYDQKIVLSNIEARASATDGIVFPLIDTGALLFRKFNHLKIEDFLGCFYLKTLMREIFSQSGLKLEGELLNDWVYNNAVVAVNTRSKSDQINNSLYVAKNTTQFTSLGERVEFELQNTPFYVGPDITFTSNTVFTPTSNMLVDVDASFLTTSNNAYVKLVQRRIISPAFTTLAICIATPTTAGTISMRNLNLYVGYQYYIEFIPTEAYPDTTLSIQCSWKITPRFIYKAFGKSCVPLWKKEDFVSNVLSLFNVISDYNPYSKTVTLNLFEKIGSKTPIDLSPYVTVKDIDYTDFISSYGKNTALSYNESDDEDLREYNISTFYKYGAGVIEVDNDFIDESADIVESDFTAPISYINPVFGASLEKINFVELDEEDDHDITSVTDSSGTPRFNMVDADDIYNLGDLVRLDTEEVLYNGDWLIDAVTSTYFTVKGATFATDTTGKVKKLVHNFTTDDSVYLFINSGNRSIGDFAPTQPIISFETSTMTHATLAYFNLINNNSQFNRDYKQGLSFGTIADPLFYQRTMTETYWRNVGRILNDPVKLICGAQLPEYIFKRLSPLVPVSIKTMESVNIYYVQRISGYKGSEIECDIELIKIP